MDWRYLVLRRLKEGSILSSSVNLFYIKNILVENTEEVKELEMLSKASKNDLVLRNLRLHGPASWSLLGITRTSRHKSPCCLRLGEGCQSSGVYLVSE